jgi:hypothetical protein
MNTPKLKLPLLTTHQAQKEVAHNEALAKLECFVQTIVLSRTTMPNNPAEGDTVIFAQQLAYYLNGAWEYYDLFDGFECWVKDESVKVVWLAGSWKVIYRTPPK